MKQFKVGLQLFSLHDKMAEDMDATLKAVKEMGYDYVELAGFHGKTCEEVKALLDKYELTAISAHNFMDDFEKCGEKVAEDLKTIGVKYCGNGWGAPDRIHSEWNSMIGKFKNASKYLADCGIQYMIHNHDFEFQKVDGEYVLDRILAATEGETLLELDTCWARYASIDVPEYIRKYSGRMKVLHLKDFECKVFGKPSFDYPNEDGNIVKASTSEELGFKLVPVGYGLQDWKPILEAAEDAGVEYVIVEQDNSVDRDAFEAVKMSRE